jgi:hypothetical protein
MNILESLFTIFLGFSRGDEIALLEVPNCLLKDVII